MKNKAGFFEKFDKEYYTTGNYSDYLKRFRGDEMIYANKLIKLLSPRKSWNFLDVGCGMGGLILALRKKGFKAIGTEISPFCLEKSPAKKWMLFGDIKKLPFKSNHFDIVICCDIFEYLDKKEIKNAVRELARTAKRFIFIDAMRDDSPNASQKNNPDNLRKKILPKKKDLIAIFQKENFEPFSPLFTKGDFNVDFHIFSVDFNMIFKKTS